MVKYVELVSSSWLLNISSTASSSVTLLPCLLTIFQGITTYLFGSNYFLISITNAVNPSTPIIIKFKSHIRCMPLWGRRPGAWSLGPRVLWGSVILKQSNQLSFSHLRITSQSMLSSKSFSFRYSHICILHFMYRYYFFNVI